MLLATDSSEGFSVPLLVAAAAVGVVWTLVILVAVIVRRPPHIRAAPAGMDLPTEGPPVAGLLVNDFVVPSETAPAILLDLAARHVVSLEEVQPGKTICRVRRTGADALTAAESLVLDEIAGKAIDGVVPAEALTTGPEEQSKRWHLTLTKDVVEEAHAAGLTYDRWPALTLSGLGLGGAVVFMLLLASAFVGGDVRGERGVVAAIAGAVAVGLLLVGWGVVERLRRSQAQLPTEAGKTAAAEAAGLAAHLRDDHPLSELPPAAVTVRGRHLAYAAAFGTAPLAVSLLPMGTEDDHRAWSNFGARWRRVRVQYPRGWPPAWGKHPAVATLLALFWGGIAGAAIYGLQALADSERPSGVPPDAWDGVGRGADILILPAALLLLWAAWVLVRAVPDLWARRTVKGEIVRDRKFRQWFSNDNENEPSYWYFLAVDDGTSDHVAAWRLPHALWREHSEGETVTAEITPRLRYVRSMVTS